MNLGIMQGRLTPSRGRCIQFFPFDKWEKEFYLGKELGIQEIEWIFDYERYEENPLWTLDGCNQIKEVIEKSGVRVRAVCFDYFMRRPFYKGLGYYNENVEFFTRIINGMAMIGATLIEVPMVDDSSVKTADEYNEAIRFAENIARISERNGIKVSFETDMPPIKLLKFLEKINKRNVYVNYDSGNSSGLGYDHSEEIRIIGKYIANVHIKDRLLHGSTVQLGTGNADFDKVFIALRDINYNSSLILQAARGRDGQEMENIRQQLFFVKKYLEKYNIGV
jgi:hexulose-6-phosphate isomerase